jgi:hypothetical protein
MKGTNDESSTAIGREVWMKLGSTMSCEHLMRRHNMPAKSGRTGGPGLQRKPLNAAEIPGDIL